MFCFRFRAVLLFHILKKVHMALICEQSLIYNTNKAIINILLNIAGSSKRLSYMCFFMCSHLSKIFFAVYRQKANRSCKPLFEVQTGLMVFHDSKMRLSGNLCLNSYWVVSLATVALLCFLHYGWSGAFFFSDNTSSGERITFVKDM